MVGVSAEVRAPLIVGIVASLTVAPRARYKSMSDLDSVRDVSRFDARSATAVTEFPNTSPQRGITFLASKDAVAPPLDNPADSAMNGGLANSSALPQPSIRLVNA